MEVDFLNDPANSHLFEESSEPAEEPEHPVRAKKRKQPEKKEKDATAQRKKKRKEPELVRIALLLTIIFSPSFHFEVQNEPPINRISTSDASVVCYAKFRTLF